MDYDNLGSAPDIDSIDLNALDLGNEIGAKLPEGDDDLPSQDQLNKEVQEANLEKGKLEEHAGKEVESPDNEENAEEDAVSGKQPRDENGRFAEKEARIPKSRFDEAVGKEREAREAAERRAQELERKLAETSANKEAAAEIERIEGEVEALELKYQELLLDGNTGEAAKVMRQIRLAERQIATAEAESRAQATTAKAIEADRLEAAIARLESDYPEFNTQSEVYDEDLVGLVLTKQRSLIQGGMSPSTALTKAGKDVAERFLKKQDDAQVTKDEAKGLAAATKQDDRKKEAVAKAIETQNAQPASTKEVGMDSDKLGEKGLPDVTKLTADEFDALPDSTKARLMGSLV